MPSGSRRTSRAAPGRGPRLVTAGAVGLTAWGALAFGSPYPWAYTPLAIGAAAVGLAALWVTRHTALAPGQVPPLLALGLVALAALLQLIPLPATVCNTLSPANQQLLARTDIAYASALITPSAGDVTSRPRPLSIDPTATERALLLLCAFLLLLWGLTRFTNRYGALHFARWIVGLGMLLALIGIIQKAVLGDDVYGGMKVYGFWAPYGRMAKPFGPFVNRNHYAGWMLMVVSVAIGYLLAQAEGLRASRLDWRERVLWLSSAEGGRLQLSAFAVFVMGIALTATLSRSGLACFAVVGGIAVLIAVRHQASLAAKIGILAILAVLLIPPVFWSNANLTSRFTAGTDGSIQLRRLLWRDTAGIVRDFPLTGTGLNTLARAMLVYQTGLPGETVHEAHNDYLQIAAEGGLLLGIPALVSIGLLVAGIRRRFTDGADDAVTSWIRFGAATGLAAIGLQSMVEFSLQMPGNAVMFVMLTALALHRPQPDALRSHGAAAH